MITTKAVQADRRLPAAKDRRGIDDVGSIKTAMQAWTAGQHEGGSTPDGGVTLTAEASQQQRRQASDGGSERLGARWRFAKTETSGGSPSVEARFRLSQGFVRGGLETRS